VIPEAAVEAAVIAMYGQARKDNKTLHKAMRLVLEAAAPFIAAQVPSDQEDRQNEIQAEVLIHARAVIVPALCTAEEWRHARVCSDFQEMIDAAQAGKLRKP